LAGPNAGQFAANHTKTAIRDAGLVVDLRVNYLHNLLMKKSMIPLSEILESLQRRARVLGITDTEWAGRAGIRKETLSRLRGRRSCDFATLQTLARVVGANVGVIDGHPAESEDGLFPVQLDREYEERLLDLCASGDVDPKRWRHDGPPFFMAGLAVMLASVPEFDRRLLLDLAESLHPGSSQVGVFALWLERSPVRPSRFLPMVLAGLRHAA
jgi:hypothetical protein